MRARTWFFTYSCAGPSAATATAAPLFLPDTDETEPAGDAISLADGESMIGMTRTVTEVRCPRAAAAAPGPGNRSVDRPGVPGVDACSLSRIATASGTMTADRDVGAPAVTAGFAPATLRDTD